jgi:glycosyltransferase involved in cell wall biosynthesis
MDRCGGESAPRVREPPLGSRGLIAVNGRFLADRMTGVQRYAFELTRALVAALAQLGRGLVVLAPGGALDARASQLPVVPGRSRLRGYAWEQLELPRMIRRAGGALLWSPANVGPLLVRQQVLTIHDAAVFAHPEWFDRRFALANRLFLPRLAHRVRHVVTDSWFSARELTRHSVVPPDRITVIPAGASHLGPTDAADPNDPPRPGPEGRYVLSVCSLEPRKNLARLLAAWAVARASAELADVTLVIVGAAEWLFRDTRFPGAATPGIRLAGYVSDEELGRYYRDAEAVVYVPLYEGFGLPPLEAMAAHVPVLASDIPALREVCGAAALYRSPWSVPEIADGLREIIVNTSLRARLRELGDARRAELTWDRAAEQLAALLEQLAGSPR